jgi:hypothetical protein
MENFSRSLQYPGVKKTVSSLILVAALTGCASTDVGSAPGRESGKAAKSSGERLRTETLIPGVGSALFPDPGWR